MNWRRQAILDVDEDDERIVFFDGIDDAIVGYGERCGQPRVVVYDTEKAVEILTKVQRITRLEAEEHFDHNIGGAWVGESTPMWLHRVKQPESMRAPKNVVASERRAKALGLVKDLVVDLIRQGQARWKAGDDGTDQLVVQMFEVAINAVKGAR